MALQAAGANLVRGLFSAQPPLPPASLSSSSRSSFESSASLVAPVVFAPADTFEPPPPRQRVVGSVGLDVDALRANFRMLDRRRTLPPPEPWPTAQAQAQIPAAERADWFEDPAFQRLLDEATNSCAEPGNWVHTLVDGPSSFKQKYDNIRTADVIFLKIYLWDNDKSGCEYAQELEEAAKRGAKIYIQYGVKSLYGPGRLTLIKEGWRDPLPPVLQRLVKYPNVRLAPNDRPTTWSNLLLWRDHEKYLVTWREGEPVRLIMGGMNISDSWVHGGDPNIALKPRVQYRDTDVEIIGPAVERPMIEFMADWGMFYGDADHGRQSGRSDILYTDHRMQREGRNVLYPHSNQDCVVRFVRNRPRPHPKGRYQYIKNLDIEMLKRVPAGDEVRIASAYFLPDKELKAAMKAADKRGVKITVLTNAPESPEFEGSLLGNASRNFFRKYWKSTNYSGNTRLFEFVGNLSTGHNSMHQKGARYGRKGPVRWGSANSDRQSLHYNYESIALMYSPQVGDEFEALWNRDITPRHTTPDGRVVGTAREITPQMLEKEPVFTKFKEKFCYRFKHWL